MMKGFAIVLMALGGGTGAAFASGQLLLALGVNHDAAWATGMSLGFCGALVFMPYASLWWSTPEELAPPPVPRTVAERWRNRGALRAEGKIQSAEARMGFVLGGISAAVTTKLTDSTWIIVAAGIAGAALGALVGHDFKRRVLQARQRLQIERPEDQDAEWPD